MVQANPLFVVLCDGPLEGEAVDANRFSEGFVEVCRPAAGRPGWYESHAYQRCGMAEAAWLRFDHMFMLRAEPSMMQAPNA